MSRLTRTVARSVAAAGLLGSAAAAFGVSPASAHSHDPATYTITVTNTTDAQWLTPPNVASHPWHTDIFQPNRPAADALGQLAENGDVPGMAAYLQTMFDDAGIGDSTVGGDGPVAPGESVTFELTTASPRFSVVSMLVCTNDGFGGVDNYRFPTRDGATRTYNLRAYDAGTEVNTEARADLVPAPFCGEGDGSGVSNPELAEDGVVRSHHGIQGVGDLDETFDFARTVGEVTITRN